MGGSDTVDRIQNIYRNSRRAAAAGNIAGSRVNARASVDSSPNEWLFGGTGVIQNWDGSSEELVLNDLRLTGPHSS